MCNVQTKKKSDQEEQQVTAAGLIVNVQAYT
jgi:hypothetical protein